MIFVDANVILRALTWSSQPEVQRMSLVAGELFRRVDRREVEITTSDAVVAEVAYILTAKTHYGVAVDDASARIATILRMPGFRLPEKRFVIRALELWVEHPKLDFVDVLTASYALRPGIELATFDRDFDRFPDITRWVPGEPPAEE
jgi:predicted nucleic acid-binding protein